ncbi:universal stress protein [Paenibacillus sp. GCM10012307]|uniref:Universal stress protein n=1 Tax=Paenibacillus roseus TaxID=2798579 RepID=A0A934J582_9BACL|nr:universal stress protein [Paenibacillus roseus]MBJ6360592.1 universal stress protein [Paenibacillus roseus]
MDEVILVCVYYGPNGERLIRRGGKIANMLNCPLHVLTVDPLPEDELDIEKIHYIEQWKEAAKEHNVQEFIIKYNEKRPVAKVISEVAKQKHVTQLVLGQTAQSRWKEITKGSIINVLLNEIPFVDIHIVSVSRELKDQEGFFEKGVRAYLRKDSEGYRLCFNHTLQDVCDGVFYKGIFYKEVGTDFNNGVFKFMKDNHMIEVHVCDDYVKDFLDLIPTAADTEVKS